MNYDNTTDSKLISVIVPVYKVEKYLKKCVDSIISQTYKNLEIILVDDGSPDNCPKLCDEYAKADKRIKVVHKDNGGLSSARNAGIMVASGELIGFVDSDDYINKNMYKDMYELLMKNNADLCICNYEYIYEDGSSFPTNTPSPIKDEVMSRKQALHKLTDPAGWYYITAVNKLYKKEILTEDIFPEGKIHEDEFSIHYIMGKCKKVVTTSKTYYHYIQRDGSIMNRRNLATELDKIEAIMDRYRYFCEIKHPDAKNILRDLYIRLYRSVKDFPAHDKKTAKRREKYLMEIVRTLAGKLDFRAAKLLLIYIYSLIPNDGFIKSKIKHFLLFIRLFRNHKKIVVLQTPIHGNIGDQAIFLAEKDFFSHNFPSVKVFEIRGQWLDSHFWNRLTLRACIHNDDLVVIHGGGFLGTLWMDAEAQLRNLLNVLFDRKIIIFPQTMYYEKDESGKRELAAAVKVYKKCRDLTVFMREKVSYDFFRKYFKGIRCELVPDMVLWMDKYQGMKFDRKDILLCMRHDHEKTQDQSEYIKTELAYLNENYIATDTVLDHWISLNKREAEVKAKIEEFAKARLIVTDRLHGMVLAAIAETPCVVILSKSHKVKGVYQWIKDLDYIELVEDTAELGSAVRKVLDVTEPKYDNSVNRTKFKPLISKVHEWSDGIG